MANAFSTNNPYPLRAGVNEGNINEAVWRLTRVMKKAGWTVLACSDGTTKVAPAANNTDNWGNNANPMLDTYPTAFGSTSSVVTPWIVMRGPSTVKIPIAVLPTGTPIRGEKITQGSAEGEINGYVFDGVTSSGWIVVLPRVGTFTNSGTITCTTSGATFTPQAGSTVVTFVREFMFSKGSASGDTTSHQIFYICADVVAENAQLYSALAATAGCTATVAPGCAASGTNQFPTLGIVIRGIAGAMTGGASIFGYTATFYAGLYHIGCTNIITQTGVSADGSFYIAGTNANPQSSGSAYGLSGILFTRIDDGDPGDCDPYVILTPQPVVISSWSRTVNQTIGGGGSIFSATNLLNVLGPVFLGYQARGCPITARDVPTVYVGVYYYNSGLGFTVPFYNYPSVLRTWNHPNTVPPTVRENLMLWCPGIPSTNTPLIKHFKGRARWLSITSLGNMLDTVDNKKWLCAGSNVRLMPAVLIGPWDGTTIPSPA